MYDESIYEEARKYLTTVLAKWRQHLPELYDDAFQEGMIQVWRDVESDVQPKLKLLRRAAICAEKFIHRNGEYSFGKPRKSRDGIRRHAATLEKVQVYLEEYLPVHNWVYPTISECSQALGITSSQAGNALKKIREGRIDHMVYREDGRKDWDYYKTISVELLNQDGDDGPSGNRSWTDNPILAGVQEVWEDDVIAEQDFLALLNKLAPEYREVLYLHCAHQYNRGDIGRHIGTYSDAVVSQAGTKRLNSAINQARMALGVYQGQCRAKHKRSPETSEILTRSGGSYYYKCRICTREFVPPPPAKVASKVGDPCGNGHTKDKTVNGYARCSACLRERQAEYRKRKAAE